MNSFVIFLKKEIMEYIKTAKGIVLIIIFLFTGISSPLIAKLTPEILNMAATDEATKEMMDMLSALIPMADTTSSYSQFFGNFTQIAMLALIIVFAGIVANEKSRNTAAYMLTKNISRTQFLLSKFVSSVIFTITAFILSIGAQILYTNILFDDKIIQTNNVMIFSGAMCVYLIFILTIILFSSVVSKSTTPATVIAFLIFMAVSMTNSIPKIGKYMPPQTITFGIFTEGANVSGFAVSIIVTVLCSAALLFASIKLFNNQEL